MQSNLFMAWVGKLTDFDGKFSNSFWDKAAKTCLTIGVLFPLSSIRLQNWQQQFLMKGSKLFERFNFSFFFSAKKKSCHLIFWKEILIEKIFYSFWWELGEESSVFLRWHDICLFHSLFSWILYMTPFPVLGPQFYFKAIHGLSTSLPWQLILDYLWSKLTHRSCLFG